MPPKERAMRDPHSDNPRRLDDRLSRWLELAGLAIVVTLVALLLNGARSDNPADRELAGASGSATQTHPAELASPARGTPTHTNAPDCLPTYLAMHAQVS